LPGRGQPLRSSLAKSALPLLVTTPIYQIFMPLSATCAMSLARARAHLLITGVDPATEFLDDFKSGVTPGRR